MKPLRYLSRLALSERNYEEAIKLRDEENKLRQQLPSLDEMKEIYNQL